MPLKQILHAVELSRLPEPSPPAEGEAEAEAEAEEEAEEEEETPAVDEDDEDLLPAAKRKEIDALFRSFGGKEGSLGSL